MSEKSTTLKYSDTDYFPDPNQIAHGPEFAVSAPIVGRMYEVTTFDDVYDTKWAVKTLRPEIANSTYYPHMSMEDVFDSHIDDHQRYQEFVGEFVSPSQFYKEIDTDGNEYYVKVDRFICAGLQYKEALKNNRQMPVEQLPPLSQRLDFVKGIAQLMNSFGNPPRIPDLDFFIETKENGTGIVLFDTGYFYPEKNEGKDRRNFSHSLSKFLFTSEEMKDEEVLEAVHLLYG
ncbi:MAG: hypothetical protein AAB546_03670, partial [Patescibacteria group bacterium]